MNLLYKLIFVKTDPGCSWVSQTVTIIGIALDVSGIAHMSLVILDSISAK